MCYGLLWKVRQKHSGNGQVLYSLEVCGRGAGEKLQEKGTVVLFLNNVLRFTEWMMKLDNSS